MRRFLYFEADGDGTAALAVPADRVAGIDVTSATAFTVYFDSVGAGGGGAANSVSSGTATSGTANTGGGGGAAKANGTSGAGGKGVVIISMPDGNYSGTTTGSPTVATDAGGTGKTVLTFTGTGSYTTT